MGTRAAGRALLLVVLATTACSGREEPGLGPDPTATSDADCATRIPDDVFGTLGWSPPKAAEATVRGCHREAEQGYVEVRDRMGSYDRLCRTLDRSGGVGPGTPAEWLSAVTACAVEPAGDVGQTKVLVDRGGGGVTEVTIVVLTGTDRRRVRSAVQDLVRADL